MKRGARPCPVERQKHVRVGKLILSTGESTIERVDVVVGACGIPLFKASSTICPACRSGWEVPENAPTERGRAQILEAQGLTARKARP